MIYTIKARLIVRCMHMKILSITAQKPHSTGSGTYLTELVRAFDKVGCKQAVVCGVYFNDEIDFPEGVSCYPVFFTDNKISFERGISSVPEVASEELFAGCKRRLTSPAADAKALPFPITGMSDIMPYTSTRYRDLDDEMISAFEEAFISTIRRAITDLDPDIIICHHLFLLTALVKKHFPRRTVYGISHGTDLRQMINCSKLADMIRPYINKIDAAFALHDEQSRQIRNIFDIDEGRVHVLGSGYNSGLFNRTGRRERDADEAVRITYAGKISKPKGVPELLSALSEIYGSRKTEHTDHANFPFEITLAGGCQDEALKQMMNELPGYVTWLGQIPQPALAELLRQTDIFVLPSYFEGLPLVLIEAMASGALPISTDLPGIREWVDENIDDSNLVLVPMPEMKSIDEPTDRGKAEHISNLAFAISGVMDAIEKGVPLPVPNTSRVTWDAVAGRVLKHFK